MALTRLLTPMFNEKRLYAYEKAKSWILYASIIPSTAEDVYSVLVASVYWAEVYKYIIILSIGFVMTSCKSKTSEKTESINTQDVNGIATSTFEVSGNCEMCKETIENSLKVEGVITADWNVDSKMMTINYDTQRISLNQIKKKYFFSGI